MEFKGIILFLYHIYFHIRVTNGNQNAKDLYRDLFLKKSNSSYRYNPEVRPVSNDTDIMEVKLGLKLSQLVDVDEINQIMVTNVWMILEWTDPQLNWDPKKYGNVQLLNVHIESIWHPNIVLYNNADGRWEMTMKTKAVLMWNGRVKWTPPGTMKSFCTMYVRYFPFDEQRCNMKFGSWTYNKDEVDIHHIWAETGPEIDELAMMKSSINLKGFYQSVEWDIMSVPGYKRYMRYAGSDVKFPEITFSIHLRRKFLFYTTNLIMPLMAHAFLTITVFYLPSASKQKVPLCISILLSLTVYFLMLNDIMPTTSMVIPLLAQYLMFTMLLVTISVVGTGITLNVHFRSSATHSMPSWMKKIFLYFLPRILCMQRPKIENSQDIELKHIQIKFCGCFGETETHNSDFGYYDSTGNNCNYRNQRSQSPDNLLHSSQRITDDATARLVQNSDFSPEVQGAIDGAIYIANHMRMQDEFNRIQEDWKYIAMVIDRMFLWFYIIVVVFGSAGIICQTPVFYDSRVPLVA